MNVVRELTHRREHPDAQGLPHRRHRAQRLRHRPRPAARQRRDHERAAREARPRGAAGRHRPRAVPRRATTTSASRCSWACSSARIALLADFFLRFTFWGGVRSRPARQRAAAVAGPRSSSWSSASCWPSSRRSSRALVQLAVSRQREYLADASSVELTRNPYGLERALAKIAADQEPLEVANRATQHLYIVNPIKKLDDARVGPVLHPPAHRRPHQPAAGADRRAAAGRRSRAQGAGRPGLSGPWLDVGRRRCG